MLRHETGRRIAVECLRLISQKHKLKIVNYAFVRGQMIMLTSGHTERVKTVIHNVAGAVSQRYGERKGRNGPFWEKAEMCVVQGGDTLRLVSAFIDKTASLASKVKDPAGNKQAGFRELAGIAKRYRLIKLEQAATVLGYDNMEAMKQAYITDMETIRQSVDFDPEAWVNYVAIGDTDFLTTTTKALPSTARSKIVPITAVNHALVLSKKAAYRFTRSIN